LKLCFAIDGVINNQLESCTFIMKFFPREPENKGLSHKFPPVLFTLTKNITDVDLSHNKIQDLDDDVFSETQIKTLTLRGNRLTMREDGPLLTAPNLEKLNLDLSGITALTPKTFQGTLHLKELLDNSCLSLPTDRLCGLATQRRCIVLPVRYELNLYMLCRRK
jgi:Leucine-rich repeat (LRR) protein